MNSRYAKPAIVAEPASSGKVNIIEGLQHSPGFFIDPFFAAYATWGSAPHRSPAPF
jgi:hypothetical protein